MRDFTKQLEEIKQFVLDTTLPTPVVKEYKKLSPQARDIKKYFDSHNLGESHSDLSKLLTIILGENVKSLCKSPFKDLPRGLAVIPLLQHRGHNYILGEVAIINRLHGSARDVSFRFYDGLVNEGNNINIHDHFEAPSGLWAKLNNLGPDRVHKYVRLATAKEIEDFFAKVASGAYAERNTGILSKLLD